MEVYIGIDNANAKYVDKNFSNSINQAMYAYSPDDGSFYSWNNSSDDYSDLEEMKKFGDIITNYCK